MITVDRYLHFDNIDMEQPEISSQCSHCGLKAGLKFAEESNRPSLVGAVTTYLAEIQLTKKPKTLAAYTTALDYCLESCKAQHVTEIDRRHMLEFTAFLRDEKEQMPRSVYNKFENVMTFLKANKVRDIVGKTDWPDAVHYVL
jgi:hypothetical protein